MLSSQRLFSVPQVCRVQESLSKMVARVQGEEESRLAVSTIEAPTGPGSALSAGGRRAQRLRVERIGRTLSAHAKHWRKRRLLPAARLFRLEQKGNESKDADRVKAGLASTQKRENKKKA